MPIQQIILNLTSNLVRHDQMEGRDFLVAPMVMLTEGVHAGSSGPMYYPREELAKTPEAWNHKPIVVYHPTMNGVGISACDPDVITSRKIGLVMNTKYDPKAAKLRAEAWIEKDRAELVDNRVLDTIERQEVMEVSTGVFTDNEAKEGDWNGEHYVGIARNYRPDHLAILPDKTGACSVEDGAGLLQINALAHGDIYTSLSASLQDRFDPTAVFVMDIFPKSVVFERANKLFKLSYTVTKNVAVLGEEDPVEVTRNVQYRLTDGTLVGNAEFPYQEREEVMPKKKELIDGLIANELSLFEEGDREFLESQDEDVLAKFVPQEKEPETTPVQNAAETGAAGLNPTPTPEEGEEETPVDAATYVQNAPPEIRDMLQAGLTAHQKEREQLISTITANENNIFTQDQLEAKSAEELKGLSALAKVKERSASSHQNYAGAVGSGVVQNEEEEEPLLAPVMEF